MNSVLKLKRISDPDVQSALLIVSAAKFGFYFVSDTSRRPSRTQSPVLQRNQLQPHIESSDAKTDSAAGSLVTHSQGLETYRRFGFLPRNMLNRWIGQSHAGRSAASHLQRSKSLCSDFRAGVLHAAINNKLVQFRQQTVAQPVAQACNTATLFRHVLLWQLHTLCRNQQCLEHSECRSEGRFSWPPPSIMGTSRTSASCRT